MDEEFCVATPNSSVGPKENVLCDTSLGAGSPTLCTRCDEWENRSIKAEERCVVLELEIQKKKIDYELLQVRFQDLESEKLAIGHQVKDLKRKNDEVEKRISKNRVVVDLTEETEDEEKLVDLMIENKTLECEKRLAESQVDISKVRFKELESKFYVMKQRSTYRDNDPNLTVKLVNETEDLQVPGDDEQPIALTKFEETSLIDTPGKDPRYVSEEKRGTRGKSRKRIRKQLSFYKEESPKKKIAPPTPVVIPASVGVANLSSDSDDSQRSKNETVVEDKSKSSLLDQKGKGDMGDYKWGSLFATTPKRKRAVKIITSDSENDDHDNLPICSLKNKRIQKLSSDPDLIDPSPRSTVSRRRLVKLSELEAQKGQEISSTNEDVVEDIHNEEEEDGYVSDSDSLDDFIVDDCSPSASESGDGASAAGEKRETRGKNRKRIRKQLSFGKEESQKKKLAPSTPTVVIPASVGVINVSSDFQESKNETVIKDNMKSSHLDQNDKGDMGVYKGSSSFATTPRRKRKIINSDSEDDYHDDDDNIPICSLKSKRIPQTSSCPDLIDPRPSSSVSKRRLVKLSERETRKGQEKSSTNEDVVEDIQSEEDASGSDTESLDGFIVDDCSPSVSESDDVASAADEESEEENLDYKDVISSLGSKSKKRIDSFNWESEADMLADFGKDIKLCMKAVCALYRQQTAEEQSSKETIEYNQRGFSHCDAYRGSTLAVFLTGGGEGDVVKSVAELREYDPKGVEFCRKVAARYSRQLFGIYERKEDLFFCPREDAHQD